MWVTGNICRGTSQTVVSSPYLLAQKKRGMKRVWRGRWWEVRNFPLFRVSCNLLSHETGHEIKVFAFYFPTKYGIPKSLKG